MSTPETIAKAAQLYVGNKLSLRQVGDRLGVTHETARRMLKEAGVEIRDPLLPGAASPTPSKTSSGWTDEREARAKALWKEGLSASQIAEQLGGVTRNAVIGKIARAGLTRSDQARKSSMAHGHKHRAPAKKTSPPKPRLMIAGNNAVLERAPDAAPVLPPVPSDAWAPLPGAPPVTIINLRPNSCRWPIDVEGAEEMHYCGRRAPDVYCAVHEDLSRPKSGTKERLDEKLGVGLSHGRQIHGRAA